MHTIAEDHVLQSTQTASHRFRSGFAIAATSPPAAQLSGQVISLLQGQLGCPRGVFFCARVSTSISSGV